MNEKNEIKFPISYLMTIKRGVFWSTRRVELHESLIKYFNPVNNQLRFEADLKDCIISEQEIGDKKSKILILKSRSNNFDDLKIKNEDFDIYDKFREHLRMVARNYRQKMELRNSLRSAVTIRKESQNLKNEDDDNLCSNLELDSRNMLNVNDEEICFKKKNTSIIQSGSTQLLEEEKGNPFKDEVKCRLSFASTITQNIKQDYNGDLIFLKTKNNCLFEFNGKDNQILNVLKENKKLVKYDWMMGISSIICIIAFVILYNLSLDTFTQKLLYSLMTLFFSIFIFINNAKDRKIIANNISLIKESDSIIKVSKIFLHDFEKDILPYFNNMDKFLIWNKNIHTYKEKKDPKNNTNYLAFYLENKHKIKIVRNINKAENSITDLNLYTKKPMINYTFDVLSNRTKVSILFHLGELSKELSFGKLTLYYINSASKNLNSLNEILIHKKFNQELAKRNSKMIIQDTHRNKLTELTPKQNENIEGPNINTIIPPQEIKNNIEPAKEIYVESINPELFKYQQLSTSICEQLSEFKNKKWFIMEDKNDYKSYYFDETSGLRSAKSETIINRPLKIVYDHLLKLDKRGDYDKNFETGHKLEEINENMWIDYLKFKGKLFFSPRDFITFNFTEYVSYYATINKFYLIERRRRDDYIMQKY